MVFLSLLLITSLMSQSVATVIDPVAHSQTQLQYSPEMRHHLNVVANRLEDRMRFWSDKKKIRFMRRMDRLLEKAERRISRMSEERFLRLQDHPGRSPSSLEVTAEDLPDEFVELSDAVANGQGSEFQLSEVVSRQLALGQIQEARSHAQAMAKKITFNEATLCDIAVISLTIIIVALVIFIILAPVLFIAGVVGAILSAAIGVALVIWAKGPFKLFQGFAIVSILILNSYCDPL